MKTLLASLVAALAIAPSALADGPPQYAAQLGNGVAHGTMRYVAVPVGRKRTMLVVLRDGLVQSTSTYAGSWGIPMTTYTRAEGVSRDGTRLFLESTGFDSPTKFMVLWTRTMKKVDAFTLRGGFSFDALSPDASRLYLIQRIQADDFSRYVVRAYDVGANRLLPGRIADRTQKGWVMRGTAVTRTTTAGGRWVYTLYMNDRGYPFIHALDTVRGVAHCIGLPWTTSQDALWRFTLHVQGPTLAVDMGARHVYRIDRTSWRLSVPRGSSFPWWWPALGALASLLVLVHTLRSVQGGSDDPEARTRGLRIPRRGSRGTRGVPLPLRGAGR